MVRRPGLGQVTPGAELCLGLSYGHRSHKDLAIVFCHGVRDLGGACSSQDRNWHHTGCQRHGRLNCWATDDLLGSGQSPRLMPRPAVTPVGRAPWRPCFLGPLSPMRLHPSTLSNPEPAHHTPFKGEESQNPLPPPSPHAHCGPLWALPPPGSPASCPPHSLRAPAPTLPSLSQLSHILLYMVHG